MDTISKLDIRHEHPSVEKYLALRSEAGLSEMSIEGATIGLPSSSFAVTLFEEGNLVGMGRVIGDGEASKLYARYGFEPVMPRSQGMFMRS